MDEKSKRHWFLRMLSVLYVIAASVLLLSVWGYCYPEVGNQIRQLIEGDQNSPVHQAFGELAEGLEHGNSVQETVIQTFRVLTGEKD